MKTVGVGIIGGGLMGREAASAFGRWFVLSDFPVKPVLKAVCDLNTDLLEWYRHTGTVTQLTTQYQELLANPEIEVVYVAVPHHLHEQIYTDVLRAGKDLLAEKPFGIDQQAAQRILEVVRQTGRFVRCSSEFPFMPGAQRLIREVQQGGMGKLLNIRAGFHHASDLDPTKPINWKRMVNYCGQPGVMADLGMHVLHIPLRFGWQPEKLYAHLQNIYPTRPDGKGGTAPCDTWDNATLHTLVSIEGQQVPMTLETWRMAPTETNTWFIEVMGTDKGFRYSTKEPKTFWTYHREKEQYWQKTDLGFGSAYPTITGGIFEHGFPDCFLQMLAAFFAEREGTAAGKWGCVTPEEATQSHAIFQAALDSQASGQAVTVQY